MSVPVVEQIARKIKARIEAVTVANGYNVTVREVFRPTRLAGFKFQDHTVNLTQDDPARNEEIDFPGNPPAIGWDQPFSLDLALRTSERDTTPLDTRINLFCADVLKGLTTPSATWHTWDGLAVISSFGDPEYFGAESDNAIVGITIPLTVSYRTNENDPYTAR